MNNILKDNIVKEQATKEKTLVKISTNSTTEDILSREVKNNSFKNGYMRQEANRLRQGIVNMENKKKCESALLRESEEDLFSQDSETNDVNINTEGIKENDVMQSGSYCYDPELQAQMMNTNRILNSTMRENPTIENTFITNSGKYNKDAIIQLGEEDIFNIMMIYNDVVLKQMDKNMKYGSLINANEIGISIGELTMMRFILSHMMGTTWITSEDRKKSDGSIYQFLPRVGEEINQLKKEIENSKVASNCLFEEVKSLKNNVETLFELNKNLQQTLDNVLNNKEFNNIIINKQEEIVEKTEERLLEDKKENQIELFPLTIIEDLSIFNGLSISTIETNEGLIINRKYVSSKHDGKLYMKEISPFNFKLFKGEINSFSLLEKEGLKVFEQTITSNISKDRNDMMQMRTTLSSLNKNNKRINLLPDNAKYYYMYVSDNKLIFEEIKKEDIKRDYYIEYTNKQNIFCAIKYNAVIEGIKVEVSNQNNIKSNDKIYKDDRSKNRYYYSKNTDKRPYRQYNDFNYKPYYKYSKYGLPDYEPHNYNKKYYNNYEYLNKSRYNSFINYEKDKYRYNREDYYDRRNYKNYYGNRYKNYNNQSNKDSISINNIKKLLENANEKIKIIEERPFNNKNNVKNNGNESFKKNNISKLPFRKK